MIWNNGEIVDDDMVQFIVIRDKISVTGSP
jgi:hypothetical protein